MVFRHCDPRASHLHDFAYLCHLQHSYSENTGVSNLRKHLKNIHDKDVKANETKQSNQKRISDIFLSSMPKRISSENSSQKHQQYIFNRQIALWICRDLIPFSTVTKDGFMDFWHSTRQKPGISLPCRATVEISALDDLYDCFKPKFVKILAAAPEHGTITFDCWTDSAKRTAYVTYTYHYMCDWTIKTAVLKTAMLAKPHTGERLKESYDKMIEEYHLNEKKITVVTDGVMQCNHT